MQMKSEGIIMQLMVIILKKTEALDDLLTRFSEVGIRGATILDSTGMASELALNHEDDIQWLGTLRSFLNPEKEKSKTILAVVDDDQISVLKAITNKVIDLSKPNTGILFSVPITNLSGGCFNN